MPSDDAMAPLERLLNLVALLLESGRPLTFEQIRETLDAYGSENLDSAKRKFERDKDILREFGIPLRMADTDVWGVEQGYEIPKDEYYLPEIAFTAEEITALFVAAQSGTEELAAEQGVRKLLYGSDGGILVGRAGGPLVSGSDARGPRVIAAAEAAGAHRHVRFGYRTSQGVVADRDVDAYAVVFRGGHWYLVGYDHEREEVRAFRLSRCTTDPVDVGEGSAPPDGFHAADQLEGSPWVAVGDERAVVAFAPDAAVLAEGSLAGATRLRERDDGWVVLAVPAPDEGSMAALVLGYGPSAEVVEPATLRREVVRRLQELVGA